MKYYVEYNHIVDKTGWGAGPWASEPDKVQWLDAETQLPCIVLRGPVGALCGYVGIYADHPLFDAGYNCEIKLPKPLIRKLLTDRDVLNLYEDDLEKGVVRPESIFAVHGGVTFAGNGTSVCKSSWETFRGFKDQWIEEAEQYPIGDAARRLKEWAGCFDDYSAYVRRSIARGVYFETDDPKPIWWLGFDCAHAGDLCPTIQTHPRNRREPDVYRDLAYVKAECVELAKQLAFIRDYKSGALGRLSKIYNQLMHPRQASK